MRGWRPAGWVSVAAVAHAIATPAVASMGAAAAITPHRHGWACPGLANAHSSSATLGAPQMSAAAVASEHARYVAALSGSVHCRCTGGARRLPLRAAAAAAGAVSVHRNARQQPVKLPRLQPQQHVAWRRLLRGPILAKGQQLVQRLVLHDTDTKLARLGT